MLDVSSNMLHPCSRQGVHKLKLGVLDSQVNAAIFVMPHIVPGQAFNKDARDVGTYLQVRALGQDPVPSKGGQRHGEGAKAVGRQPGNEMQQFGLQLAP